MKTGCELVYDILGVAKADDQALLTEFRDEVEGRLTHVKSVDVHTIDGGVRLKIAVNDIAPFDRNDFESFVYDHAVWDSTQAYFEIATEAITFDLVSEKYGL